MKKSLFVLAFAFIGQQAFSQMYIVTLRFVTSNHSSNCQITGNDMVMTTIDPQGSITYECVPNNQYIQPNGSGLSILNQNFNSIISQGYKFVGVDADNSLSNLGIQMNGSWYFAIP